jgi:hypothetical protein
MSAALQLPNLDPARIPLPGEGPSPAVTPGKPAKRPNRDAAPVYTLAFYRKHTQAVLRRYLYASMVVGRSPDLLREPLRGWASSRPVHSFEDAVIFVLDVEKCLGKLSPLDRTLLGAIVLQEYEPTEVAMLLSISLKTVMWRLQAALDRLTSILLDTGLLVLPRS